MSCEEFALYASSSALSLGATVSASFEQAGGEAASVTSAELPSIVGVSWDVAHTAVLLLPAISALDDQIKMAMKSV